MAGITAHATLDVRSMAAVMRALDGVKQGVQNRVIKGAIAKVARAAASVARSDAPRGATGILSKSLGTRYKSYSGGLVWVYAIGPRTGFSATGPGGVKQVASKIAHLAEGGRKAISPRPGGVLRFWRLKWQPGGLRKRGAGGVIFTRKKVAAVAPTRFMRSAWIFVLSRQRSLERDIIEGIERESMKYGAKGKSIYG